MDERTRRDFGEFVAGRSPELLRLAYVLTGDQHAAEDLLQSALTKAAAHWGRIEGAPEGYVRRILYREQVSWWRRRARRPEIVMAHVPERPARDEVVMVEARLALREALLALPPGKRVMLVLRYLEDLTVTALQSAQVVPSDAGGYQLEIILTRAETSPFAALTRKVSGLPSPRDRVAIIIDGRVIADPAVQSAIPGGNAQISGFATRAQAESLLSSLLNR